MNKQRFEQFLTNAQLKHICQSYHVKKLAFFGSVLRPDFSSKSDLDILVEFETGHVPGFYFFLIESELSKIAGRKVDLQTVKFFSPAIRDSALSEAVVAYEQV